MDLASLTHGGFHLSETQGLKKLYKRELVTRENQRISECFHLFKLKATDSMAIRALSVRVGFMVGNSISRVFLLLFLDQLVT